MTTPDQGTGHVGVDVDAISRMDAARTAISRMHAAKIVTEKAELKTFVTNLDGWTEAEVLILVLRKEICTLTRF